MSPAVVPLWQRFGLQGLARMKAVCRNAKPVVQQQIRHSGGGIDDTMNIVPSRWNWDLWKDYMHIYTMVWGVPLLSIVLYSNLYVGPARLQPIPEGYQPKQWEYFRHPIERWFMKYLFPTEQESYERGLHTAWENDKIIRQRMLIDEVKRLMKEEGDYKGYYHVPVTGRFLRVHRKALDQAVEERAVSP